MYFNFSALLPLALVTAGASAAASNLSSSTCGPECQKNVLYGNSWEEDQHASSDFAFYTVPSNFSSKLDPGCLLAVEQVTDLANYSIPSGLSMSRILYTTNDLNGTTLPASAYILWPYETLDTPKKMKEGYPMVAWAHGTSGVLRGCAPSNYRNLQYHFMAPFLLALQGMAVVAPDYAGLGINTLPNGQEFSHPWLTGPAQANDLSNAIKAARKAFPSYLKAHGPFVAMGHSQGGGAAWSFAEKQVKEPISGYKGTVSIAPPTRTIDVLKDAFGAGNSTQPWAQLIIGAQPKLIEAVTAIFPSYNYSGLTPVSYDRWFNVLKPLDGCLPTDSLAFFNVSANDLAVPNWYDAPEAQEYAKLSESGRKKFKGPILIVSGESDSVVPHSAVVSAVDDTCSMLTQEYWNESLEFVSYSAMDHFPAIQASQLKWLPWIKDRLSGVPVWKTGCVKSTVNGFRTDATVQSAEPNFLEGWASAEEGWKYTL